MRMIERGIMGGYKIHRKVKVKDGYEVTATLTDGDETRNKLFFCPGDKEPVDKDLDGKLTNMLNRFIEKNKIVPDVQMMKSEVEELLRNKGYLTENQNLEDLSDKEVL